MIKSLKKTEHIKKANKNLEKLTDICSGYIYFLNFKEGEEKKSNNSNVKIYRTHIIYKK